MNEFNAFLNSEFGILVVLLAFIAVFAIVHKLLVGLSTALYFRLPPSLRTMVVAIAPEVERVAEREYERAYQLALIKVATTKNEWDDSLLALIDPRLRALLESINHADNEFSVGSMEGIESISITKTGPEETTIEVTPEVG